MLICYYLGAVLMLSDGTNANPLTALQDFRVANGWLAAQIPRGGLVWYELNPDESDLNVDEVLQRCDQRAHDPQKHP